MADLFRISRHGEFTFKRDSEGVETRGLIIGRTEMSRLGPIVHLIGGLAMAVDDVDDAHAAADAARSAGFWSMDTPGASMSPVAVTVRVGGHDASA